LEITACFVQRGQGQYFNLLSVVRFEIQVLALVTKHHTTHLCLLVLQGKIPMSRSGTDEIGNFTAHPQQRQASFDDLPGRRIEFADAEYLRLIDHAFQKGTMPALPQKEFIEVRK